MDKRAERVSSELIERLASLSPAELFVVLEEGDNDEKRQAAIELGQRGYRAAFDPLVRALQNELPSVADGAALGLAELGDVRALPPLLAAIRDRRRRGQGASALVFALIEIDVPSIAVDLAGIVLQGTYPEAMQAGAGLRDAWDHLLPTTRTAVRDILTAGLRETRDMDPWRMDFIEEILEGGGWSPGERRQWNG